ncbi:MAG TPA: M48 family metallopeptidase [Chloroflexia bacterium]|nr:M48 family metallopeptidase [Chloroflexia bacterium]
MPNPVGSDPTHTRFESLYISLGRRLNKVLFDEMIGASTRSLRPTLTPSKVLAFLLAASVHFLTFSIALIGVLLLIVGWQQNACLFIIALPLLLLAWFLRPQVGKFKDTSLPPAQFPTLYKLMSDISSALNTSNVSAIVVNEPFNAAFDQVGWRWRKVVYIGLPLLDALEPQERVALLSHEVAHGVNGDPTRGFFVGTALNSLIQWYGIVHPGAIWDTDNDESILAVPGNLMRAAFAAVVWSWYMALVHLVWRDMQRAEYLADYLASAVSGTDAMISLLHKLEFADTFDVTVQNVALSRKDRNVFKEARQRLLEIPHEQLERSMAAAQDKQSRLNVTHPPSVNRVRFLRAHHVSEARVALSTADSDRIDQELAGLKDEIQEKLLDAYHDSLY